MEGEGWPLEPRLYGTVDNSVMGIVRTMPRLKDAHFHEPFAELVRLSRTSGEEAVLVSGAASYGL